MTVSICGKCAHESAAALKPMSPRTEKIACEICGRKRFCMVYEVKGGGKECDELRSGKNPH